MRSVVARWFMGGAALTSAMSIASSFQADRLIVHYGGPDRCGIRIPLPPGPGRFALASIVLAATALLLVVAALVWRARSARAWGLLPPAAVLAVMLGGFALVTAVSTWHGVKGDTLTARPRDCSI
jgi:hypothetical protein